MFTLDSRLENDSVFVCDLKLCQARLMNDKNYPWLILIPRVEEVREIFELSESDQQQLMRESSQISQLLFNHFDAHKMNVAALGNLVPQLHIHHIARFETDSAWPGPVWGVGDALPYAKEEQSKLVDKLASLIKQ